MSREKQIEEMKEVVCDVLNFDICNKFDRCDNCPTVGIINALYNAGYRKQSEGEWITLFEDDSPWDSIWICNRCGAYTTTEEPAYKNFCPNCGAKMKGGAE